ncbi:uncharacterized protein BO96DRAFT_228148 [Aspergillus niger CBS 101883]|uniref:uncharacterized protein n=1 Tax=Aspergillus lacticoffeatus (strain CBS 101883) TaxID=1450533 RepID=UPI000D801FB9|nr:uncharacterized protein BO96DRAFT_228148 [Aspergillus niger CBS 101883]PYH58837.1 hypothetical protein BO96DRAFT_228148 [Aspergillus niger CBS 101883]
MCLFLFFSFLFPLDCIFLSTEYSSFNLTVRRRSSVLRVQSISGLIPTPALQPSCPIGGSSTSCPSIISFER